MVGIFILLILMHVALTIMMTHFRDWNLELCIGRKKIKVFSFLGHMINDAYIYIFFER